EIIIIKNDAVQLAGHHTMLNANGLAQAEALQKGKSADEIKSDAALPQSLINQKTFSGNRPSSTIVLDALSPFAIGQLIALYEHKVFAESVFWNLNPFDQWGVELGKTLATPIQNALEIKAGNTAVDGGNSSSTTGLINRLRNL
ncbi:MAG: glucose-6-phosphate isomerase, partial [Alphaproteobacteria bacterium]|nr:glucose-6-phosphate isomerase [Alphaproteobacteria bacterium]